MIDRTTALVLKCILIEHKNAINSGDSLERARTLYRIKEIAGMTGNVPEKVLIQWARQRISGDVTLPRDRIEKGMDNYFSEDLFEI